MDDIDETEEEGHLRGHLGYVGKQAALGQDLGHYGGRQRHGSRCGAPMPQVKSTLVLTLQLALSHHQNSS